jgi:hypothetical protein
MKLTVKGNTYSDDGTASKDMDNGGFRKNLMPLIGDAMSDMAEKVAAAADQVALANAAAQAAAMSASTAVTGPGSSATSTTSLTLAMGMQSLLIQAGKTLSIGMPITIASAASPRDWMNGTLMSYNVGTGALVVNVTNIGVATTGVYPTAASWVISLSGVPGTSSVINEIKAVPIASAATVNLDAATGNLVHVTGSATISAITLAPGAERAVVVDGAPLIVAGPNLVLPGGASVQADPGDVIVFRGDGGGKVIVTSYTRGTGLNLGAGVGVEVFTLSGTFTPDPHATFYLVEVVSGGDGGTGGTGGVNYVDSVMVATKGRRGEPGSHAIALIPASLVQSPVPVLVGAGGVGSVGGTGKLNTGYGSNNQPGAAGTGGTSSFGDLVVAAKGGADSIFGPGISSGSLGLPKGGADGGSGGAATVAAGYGDGVAGSVAVGGGAAGLGGAGGTPESPAGKPGGNAAATPASKTQVGGGGSGGGGGGTAYSNTTINGVGGNGGDGATGGFPGGGGGGGGGGGVGSGTNSSTMRVGGDGGRGGNGAPGVVRIYKWRA